MKDEKTRVRKNWYITDETPTCERWMKDGEKRVCRNWYITDETPTCKHCGRSGPGYYLEEDDGSDICSGCIITELLGLRETVDSLFDQAESDTETAGILADVVDTLWNDPERAEKHGYGDPVAKAKSIREERDRIKSVLCQSEPLILLDEYIRVFGGVDELDKAKETEEERNRLLDERKSLLVKIGLLASAHDLSITVAEVSGLSAQSAYMIVDKIFSYVGECDRDLRKLFDAFKIETISPEKLDEIAEKWAVRSRERKNP